MEVAKYTNNKQRQKLLELLLIILEDQLKNINLNLV